MRLSKERRIKCYASCNIIRARKEYVFASECREEATTDQQERRGRRPREASSNDRSTMR